jgi:O-glycosyl hydrolase
MRKLLDSINRVNDGGKYLTISNQKRRYINNFTRIYIYVQTDMLYLLRTHEKTNAEHICRNIVPNKGNIFIIKKKLIHTQKQSVKPRGTESQHLSSNQ